MLSLISKKEYEDDALSSIGDLENVTYNDTVVLAGVKQKTEKIAATVFEDRMVDYERTVMVAEDDEHAECTLEVAEKHGCDHIFGDTVQRPILSFDGFVTDSIM
ncbi:MULTISPECIES: hypothetical protein [unclassified Haladaptatus]|uniref:hypothetical protein n=1 Tax=unclassified Haladaptatus TaxID=2622732 RepID=UPI00209BE425|nr:MULTISPECIES: hypothetical protein [unclassified Haladaptatus]MCO8245282.1 hypothetical protein [Haladaptatus sp. AB643]MCO8256612.1 hypothetical protein [Haladaptatus sp. AB618]